MPTPRAGMALLRASAMSEERPLVPIPEIPPEITKAATDGSLVLFVGAGVSMLAEAPSWEGLASKAMKQACEKHKMIPIISQLIQEVDPNPKRQLSLTEKKCGRRAVDYRSILEFRRPSTIHTAILSLNCACVTTNYDNGFDVSGAQAAALTAPSATSSAAHSTGISPRRIFDSVLSNGCEASLRTGDAIVHLHGAILDSSGKATPRGKLVVTVEDYLEHYSKQKVRDFVSTLFSKYTVLFLGYGLAELELLEHLHRLRSDSGAAKHFMLLPLFQYQEPIRDLLEQMYTDLNVTVIPYWRDQKDYQELERVIDAWRPYILVSFANRVRHLRTVLAGGDFDTAFRMWDQMDVLVPHFFRYAEGLKSLDVLLRQGRLTIDVLEAYGPAREYATRVARECDDAEENALARRLLAIWMDDPPIEEAVAKYPNSGWCLAEVMARVPPGAIAQASVRRLSAWMVPGRGPTAIGHEIATSLFPRLLDSELPRSAGVCFKLVELATKIEYRPVPDPVFEEVEALAALDIDSLREMLCEDGKSTKFGAKCGLKAVELLAKRVAQALRGDGGIGATAFWRQAIEDHEQNLDQDEARGILTTSLRDALLGHLDTSGVDDAAARGLLKKWLAGRQPILWKLAVYAIDAAFDRFRELLPDVFRLLLNPDVRYETYHLLDRHFRRMATQEQDGLIEAILGMHGASAPARSMVSARRALLHAIRDKGNSRAERLYREHCSEFGGAEPEHPDLLVWMADAQWEEPNAPDWVTRMLDLSVADLVDRIGRLPRPGEDPGVPAYEVYRHLSAAARTRSEHFWQQPAEMARLPAFYLAAVIEGSADRWDGGEDIEWDPVLAECLARVSDSAFWGGGESGRHLLVSAIGKLVRAGTADDKHAVDAGADLRAMEEILRRVLPRQESSTNIGSPDAVNRAINSPRGHCIEALLAYSGRRARMADRASGSHKSVWTGLADLYDALLTQDDGNYEFRALCCRYAGFMLYLDRDWFMDHIEDLFDKEREGAWNAAMDGYVYTTQVHERIYKALRAGGHLKRAVDQRRGRDRIVQQIMVVYVEGWERLDDGGSLLRYVLDQWKETDVRSIVTFFLQLRSEARSEGADRYGELATALWHWYVDELPDSDAERSQILAWLSELAVYLDDVGDDNREWLEMAARGMRGDDPFRSYVFIRELDRLSESSPANVARVFRALCEAGRPPYISGEVLSLMGKLKAYNDVAHAIDDDLAAICDAYGRAGEDPDRLGGVC